MFSAKNRVLCPRRGVGVGLALSLAVGLCSTVSAQVTITQITRNLGGGATARGWQAVVDLTSPRVRIVTNAPSLTATGGDALLSTTPTFRVNTGARVAINANFYGTVSASVGDIIGLSANNGVVVSPVRQFGSFPDPAITFDRNNLAKIDFIASNDPTIFDAVAGVGPSNTDSDPGTLLVTDGVNTGATARVQPTTRTARTAVGINQAGTTLYMVTFDIGTNSSGINLTELASYMISIGAWRAINLDGGGSTSFSATLDNGSTVQNTPSGGSFRAVANHLGVVLLPTNAVYRTTRPIRGAWLRPPGFGSSGANPATDGFQNTVQNLAAAGVTDIFLETLFWGRDTGRNNDPNFPHRFSTDYLQNAILIAKRFGMRLHAWCETGYLDFGTNPSAFLAANPSFVVDHRDPANTITGDLANQRFVNLGNPGVRTALNNYFTRLTTNYVGLWGIQADYHFFPLAPSGAAPWSYDSWALSAFQAQFGRSPLTNSNTAGSTYDSEWLGWNRNNVTQALVQIRDAVNAVSTRPVFSAVAFADWNGATHTSKMIDLPAWGTSNAAEQYFVMSYFSSTTAINTDLQRAQTALPGRRIVAGLANLTNQTRPPIIDQLNVARGRGIEDWAWFDAPTFINNPAMRADLRSWILNTATQQRGDFNQDGYIDARDWQFFRSIYSGAPVAVTVANQRLNYNTDAVIDESDWQAFRGEFARFRFGDDGVVDQRSLDSFLQCLNATQGPSAGVLHLYDLNGDGVVNYSDQLILHSLLTVSVAPDIDVNRDTRFDLDDLYRQNQSPIDVNRDGEINANDSEALASLLRANEIEEMSAGRR